MKTRSMPCRSARMVAHLPRRATFGLRHGAAVGRGDRRSPTASRSNIMPRFTRCRSARTAGPSPPPVESDQPQRGCGTRRPVSPAASRSNMTVGYMRCRSARTAARSPPPVTIERQARLWDAATGQPRGEPLQHEAQVVAVWFSPDGRTLATASNRSTGCGCGTRRPVSPAASRSNMTLE